jgi:hypothetical protein
MHPPAEGVDGHGRIFPNRINLCVLTWRVIRRAKTRGLMGADILHLAPARTPPNCRI